MIRKIIYLAAAFVFLVITFHSAHAQSNYAVVRGSILDPHRRPIAGAHIRLISTDTGAMREVVSNASGLYEIAALQPGSYSLQVENHGFAQATHTIVLEVGQQATLDIPLSIGADTESVTVDAAGELLKT